MKRLCTTINNVEIDLPVGGRERATGYSMSGCSTVVSTVFLPLNLYALQDTFGRLTIYKIYIFYVHMYTLHAQHSLQQQQQQQHSHK